MSESAGSLVLGPGVVTPPITVQGGAGEAKSRLAGERAEVPGDVVRRLEDACGEVSTDPEALGEAGRDWWPLAMTWATEGEVPARPHVAVRPGTVEEVAAVLAVCDEAAVPATAAAGRSGVCGGSIPVHGGVVIDLTALDQIIDIDDTSLIADLQPGIFGDHLEDTLRREHGVTLGHWPQSIALSTVGGWVACRSAGQMSNRYGKIEDMVVGLDVALADGRLITTGGAPRAAVGPDLTQLFVGSEGTLGLIVGARLRLHRLPDSERRAAYGFADFDAGLDACRRILQRGARPAVLRLYDAVESARNFSTDDVHALLVLDEGDAALVDATMAVVREESSAAQDLDDALVGQWLEHRNDVSALEQLVSAGWVVDTMEIAADWQALPGIFRDAIGAIEAVDSTQSVSAHQSHSYTDGACLYFTFAGQPDAEAKDAYYTAAWEAGTRAVLAGGGALSHHHGVGLNRSRFVAEALGPAFESLVAVKGALDPHGILNPGKLGLPSPFGEPGWP